MYLRRNGTFITILIAKSIVQLIETCATDLPLRLTISNRLLKCIVWSFIVHFEHFKT